MASAHDSPRNYLLPAPVGIAGSHSAVGCALVSGYPERALPYQPGISGVLPTVSVHSGSTFGGDLPHYFLSLPGTACEYAFFGVGHHRAHESFPGVRGWRLQLSTSHAFLSGPGRHLHAPVLYG